MEMLVFMSGILLCLVLSVIITLYVVQYVNKYQPVLAAVLMLTLMTTFCDLYNNVMYEYFIGKRVTYEQICTEVSVVTLYFK